MAASVRLSLVSRSSIGPATENASSRPAMHRMCSFGISHFSLGLFCGVKNGCFCAFIACVSVFNRTCHRKCKLQACNAPNVQFWHKPFFSNFSAVSKWLLLHVYRFLELIASSFCGVNGMKNDTQSMSPAQDDTTNDTEHVPCARMTRQMTQSMAPAQE